MPQPANMRRAVTLAAGALACALVQSGCAHSTQRWGTAHELRIGITGEPSSLNPLFEWTQSGIDITQLYAETLVGLDEHNHQIPLVAQRIPTRENGDIGRDGLTLTYRLRHDERFADGQPLTSRDVAFTYRAILDARNPVTEAQPYRNILWLKTPDRYTVVIRLRRPWAAAVAHFFAVSDFAYGILPAHVFQDDTNLTRAQWNQRPFGSGPFRVISWRHGDSIELEPNPYARRRPHMRRVTLKILPDLNTLFLELRTHAIDLAALNNEQVVQARKLGGMSIVQTPKNNTDFLDFQTRRPPTDDPLVRRALVEAIDRREILRRIYLDMDRPATTEEPDVLWAHDATIRQPDFDPKRAARDLDAAGWNLSRGVRSKNGAPMQVEFAYVNTSDEARRLATQVQADLRNLGVETILRPYPAVLFFAAGPAGGIERGGRFNITYSDWFGGVDPEDSETYTCDKLAPRGPNMVRWCNPAYDHLYELASRSPALAARKNYFAGMQRLVRSATVSDFLAYTSTFTCVNPALRGYAPNMLFAFDEAENWDLVP
jgi:peptide/nickel transport system substrate-binding protein